MNIIFKVIIINFVWSEIEKIEFKLQGERELRNWIKL